MFFIIKALSSLLAPLPVIIGILMTGIFFLWFTKKQKAGKVLVSGAAILLLILSYGFISDGLLKHLEHRYPPLLATNELSPVKWIVVLGGGHISDPSIPLTSQLSAVSLVRLTEGVRLYRELPGSKILLVGGAVFDQIPEVEISARIAGFMGVKSDDLLLEKKSKDTEEQAQIVKKIVGYDRFILVTSASHMFRSMALFKKNGLDPIPAPTNYYVIETQGFSPGDLFPSLGGLGNAQVVIYEYLSLCWSRLRGKS